MELTTMCYLRCEGRMLMLHRTKKKHDDNKGKWMGIGGHIEAGETPMDCILREAREEAGIRLLDARQRGIVHFRNDLCPDEDIFLFTASRYEGDIIVCNEGDLEWIPEDAVDALNMWPGDRVFLKLLRDGADGFELTLRYHGDKLIGAAMDGEPIDIPTEAK